jgi:hypothetical protein
MLTFLSKETGWIIMSRVKPVNTETSVKVVYKRTLNQVLILIKDFCKKNIQDLKCRNFFASHRYHTSEEWWTDHSWHKNPASSINNDSRYSLWNHKTTSPTAQKQHSQISLPGVQKLLYAPVWGKKISTF